MDKLRFLGLHAAAVSSEDASLLSPRERRNRHCAPPSGSRSFFFKGCACNSAQINLVSYPVGPMPCGIHLRQQGLASSRARRACQPPLCRFAVVPSNMSEQLVAREQDVGRLEALACLLGPWNHPEILKGRNVMHFIDNASAVSGCIQGGSWVPDSSIIFQLHALSLAASGCRYWAEYVASSANR